METIELGVSVASWHFACDLYIWFKCEECIIVIRHIVAVVADYLIPAALARWPECRFQARCPVIC